jgi:hypothetical protein
LARSFAARRDGIISNKNTSIEKMIGGIFFQFRTIALENQSCAGHYESTNTGRTE